MTSRHLALVVAFFTLLGAAPAGATVLVTPDGQIAPQPYQSWVDAAYVPTPPGEVVLSLEGCPAAARGGRPPAGGRPRRPAAARLLADQPGHDPAVARMGDQARPAPRARPHLRRPDARLGPRALP